MKRLVTALIFALAASAAAQQSGARQKLDYVAAVVGDEVILASQVKLIVLQTAQEQNIDLSDSTVVKELSRQALDAEIANKVVLHHAKEADIEISEERVNQLVESKLEDMRRQFSSDRAFQQALDDAGQTLLGLKDVYREQARQDLLRQTYLQEHSHEFPRVKVGEDEAREFFESQPVGSSPAQVRFQHMLIEPEPGEDVVSEARTELDSVYKLLESGVNFTYLAEKFSDGPSASKGGDLGFFSKGDMVKEFEEAAFDMQVGEVRMVRTKYGWHLIRVEARRQKEVRARHILISTEVTEQDWARAFERAEAIRQQVIEGADFYELALENSDDTSDLSRNPPFAVLSSLQQDVLRALNGEMEQVPGTTHRISQPVEVRPRGYLLVIELERKEEAPLSFDEVRQQIMERLQQSKAIEAYVEQLREKTYIDIRFEDYVPLASGL